MDHLVESFADIDHRHLLGKCKELGAKVYIGLFYLIWLVYVDLEDQGILDTSCCLLIKLLVKIHQVKDTSSSLLQRLSRVNDVLGLSISHCEFIESCDFSSWIDMKQLYLIIAYDLKKKAILEFELLKEHI